MARSCFELNAIQWCKLAAVWVVQLACDFQSQIDGKVFMRLPVWILILVPFSAIQAERPSFIVLADDLGFETSDVMGMTQSARPESINLLPRA